MAGLLQEHQHSQLGGQHSCFKWFPCLRFALMAGCFLAQKEPAGSPAIWRVSSPILKAAGTSLLFLLSASTQPPPHPVMEPIAVLDVGSHPLELPKEKDVSSKRRSSHAWCVWSNLSLFQGEIDQRLIRLLDKRPRESPKQATRHYCCSGLLMSLAGT